MSYNISYQAILHWTSGPATDKITIFLHQKCSSLEKHFRYNFPSTFNTVLCKKKIHGTVSPKWCLLMINFIDEKVSVAKVVFLWTNSTMNETFYHNLVFSSPGHCWQLIIFIISKFFFNKDFTITDFFFWINNFIITYWTKTLSRPAWLVSISFWLY